MNLIKKIGLTIKAVIYVLWILFTRLLGVIFFLTLAAKGVLYTFLKHLLKGNYQIKKQFLPIANGILYASDGVANAAAGELLTDVVLKSKKGIDPKAVKYSRWYHTISAITGINLLKRAFPKGDSWFRRFLDKVLGKDHCTEAITEEQHKFYL